MSPETITDFLTGYVRSLSEETRSEAKGPRHGLDHVIFELAQAEGLIPLRLSFLRQGEGELSKPKKEAEHGVDAAFISPDRSQLTVFVLKDEVLSYKNWTDQNFDYDLRRARDQNITAPELSSVTEVRIVLAYNKDDDEEGIESFDRFVSSSGTKIGDKADLTFERWNLSIIVEKVQRQLLTPSLLPESFFRRFTYLCWQVGDFTHGSPQWREVLLPDWREFLDSVLTPPVTERSIRLISVALAIIQNHGKKTENGEFDPSFETGSIDLAEWATLALWNAIRGVEKEAVRHVALQIWFNTYVVELERYYTEYIEILATEHSLELSGGSLSSGASVYLAYWHMARLGLFSMALGEVRPSLEGQARHQIDKLIVKCTDWIVRLLNANPSCQRPMLDIHHIEIFLVWRALVQCDKWGDALNWFHSIFERLVHRRIGKSGLRVIDYGNSWDSLFEYLATQEEPHAGFGKSSYLLLMMMEIALGAPNDTGVGLASAMHRQLILGKNGSDTEPENLPFKEKVELMGWMPPSDWAEKILRQRVDDGIALPVHFSDGEGEQAFNVSLRRFVEKSSAESPQAWKPGVPSSVFVLACIKRTSPLPNDFWRALLFPRADSVSE